MSHNYDKILTLRTVNFPSVFYTIMVIIKKSIDEDSYFYGGPESAFHKTPYLYYNTKLIGKVERTESHCGKYCNYAVFIYNRKEEVCMQKSIDIFASIAQFVYNNPNVYYLKLEKPLTEAKRDNEY